MVKKLCSHLHNRSNLRRNMYFTRTIVARMFMCSLCIPHFVLNTRAPIYSFCPDPVVQQHRTRLGSTQEHLIWLSEPAFCSSPLLGNAPKSSSHCVCMSFSWTWDERKASPIPAVSPDSHTLKGHYQTLICRSTHPQSPHHRSFH